MEYIKGRITIFDQLKSFSGRGYSYYGAVKTELLEDPLNLPKILSYMSRRDTPLAESISCSITSAEYNAKGEIQEGCRHCVIIYPKVCNRLKAVYVQENGTYAPMNLIEN